MKRIVSLIFIAVIVAAFASCGGNTPSEPHETGAVKMTVPDDFTFAVRWGVYGISSYDSRTGKLIKTTDMHEGGDPDRFTATVMLDDETALRFYKLLSDLDLASYPEDYDPGCGYSAPSALLELAFTANGESHSVRCDNISLEYRVSGNQKGQAFLDAINEITDYLTSTSEWNALPDYEFIYD